MLTDLQTVHSINDGDDDDAKSITTKKKQKTKNKNENKKGKKKIYAHILTSHKRKGLHFNYVDVVIAAHK